MQKNTHPFRALAPLQAGASGQAPAPLTGQGQDRGGQAGVDHCPRAALFVHFDGERQEFPLLIKCRNVFLGSPLHPAWAPGHHFRRPSQGKAAPPVPGAPGSPLNGGHRAPGRGRSLTTMPREALLLLVSLALLLTLPAPLLAFPSAAPGNSPSCCGWEGGALPVRTLRGGTLFGGTLFGYKLKGAVLLVSSILTTRCAGSRILAVQHNGSGLCRTAFPSPLCVGISQP